MALKKKLKLTLSHCFGIATAPNGTIGWHGFITAGLPYSAICAIAHNSGVPEDLLWGVLQIEKPKSAKGLSKTLRPEQSDVLYRVAKSCMYLTEKLESKEAVAQWWSTRLPNLGNHMPIELVASTPGYDLVNILIDRIEVATKKETHHRDEPQKVEPIEDDVPMSLLEQMSSF